MTTTAQMTKAFYDQDSAWARIVQRAARSKSPRAPAAKAFLQRQWTPVLWRWLDVAGRLAPDVPLAHLDVEEILRFVHRSLYPTARDVGFPETSFILAPDISLEDEDRVLGADYREPIPRFEAPVGAAGGARRGGSPLGARRRLTPIRVPSTNEGSGGGDDSEDQWDDAELLVSGGGHHHGGHHRGRRRGRRTFDDGWGYGYDDAEDRGDVIIENTIYNDGDPTMNSYDPWRVMQSSPPALEPVLPMVVGGGYGGEWEQRGANRPRDGLLADVAPLFAPATGSVAVASRLDGRQVLHVTICVDGKCYRTSANLAPAIADVMARLANMRATAVSGETAVGAIDDAVRAAGDAMVGALIDQHVDAVCAGWWDDVTDAVSSVGSAIKGGVMAVHHAASGIVQKLKGPITLAATAVATVYGGPAGGALAAKLTGPIIDATADIGKDNKSAKAAQKVVATVKNAAKSSPGIARALRAAQAAVVHTTAAYHVAETVKNAAVGDPAAQQQVVKMDQAAQDGDPAAQIAMELAGKVLGLDERSWNEKSVMSPNYKVDENLIEMEPNVSGDPSVGSLVPVVALVAAALGGYAWWRHRHPKALAEQAMLTAAQADVTAQPAVKAALTAEAVDLAAQAKAVSAPAAAPVVGTGGPRVEIIGAAIDELRKQAADAAAKATGRVVGVFRTVDGCWTTQSFASSDDADDWFGDALDMPDAFVYAAYYDKGDPTWPHPLNEAVGHGQARAAA